MWLYEKSIIDQTKFTIVLRICSLFLQHELIKYIHELSFYLLIIAVNVARSQLMLLWILGKCGRNYGRFRGHDPPAQPYFPIHQFSVCPTVIESLTPLLHYKPEFVPWWTPLGCFWYCLARFCFLLQAPLPEEKQKEIYSNFNWHKS